MSINLTLTEQETCLSMTADDRNAWHVYSDDPVMQRRLEAIGATLTQTAPDGVGKHYTLPANQVTLRKPRKPMTEAQRQAARERIRRTNQAKVVSLDTN